MLKVWLLMIVLSLSDKSLINSTWTYHVAPNCVNTLKFISTDKLTHYDCELDYTFKDTYKITGDTLFLLEPDDSHSEDGGKVAYYRSQYLIKGNKLYCISAGEFIKKRWIDKKLKITSSADWVRSD